MTQRQMMPMLKVSDGLCAKRCDGSQRSFFVSLRYSGSLKIHTVLSQPDEYKKIILPTNTRRQASVFTEHYR